MYIGDRKEREEYMDNLERQMEDQRGRIQRTLDRLESSGRRGGALERLRRSLPRFPSRAPARDAEQTSGDTSETPESPGPSRDTLATPAEGLKRPRSSWGGWSSRPRLKGRRSPHSPGPIQDRQQEPSEPREWSWWRRREGRAPRRADPIITSQPAESVIQN